MNIKESIKTLLQTKFGGVVLSDARIEQFAKGLANVKDEAELKAQLNVVNLVTPFSGMKSDDDRYRTAQSELEKLKKPTPAPVPTPEPTPDPAPAQGLSIEDINKVISSALKPLANSLAGLQGQKLVTDRKTAILAKLDGASDDYKAKVVRDFGYMNFADDNAFGEFLGHVESDYAAHVQTQAESSLGKDAPFLGVGSDGRVKEASKAELDAVMSEIKF
ncbi:hypothetical protein [Sphingobacterium hotanense]|uniref:Uncharacterized protein n=1 Tax=Sphingobacterium hotanense TaxID=649196 RepID=A0ABT7NQD1_9SPHI|nr:hypothetical protein [Sphingobacterium hotanense]MDM1049370.1 hypothetical protein [Sphingobacterium hotanense]